MRALASLPLILLLVAGTTRAEVHCNFGGDEVSALADEGHYTYSSSGIRGPSGRLSHFRLMTLGMAGKPSHNLELKTFDVKAPGVYELSTETLWRSVLRAQGGKRLKVGEGRFQFSQFEVHGPRGRAAGTVEFNAEGVIGRCRFDVEVKGFDRDLLGAR